MGRKPNQLILEFFERGPKLEDASNRYQHTCKSCGEKFPKGRIDSLTSHLVKKCPALPMRDRQRAILQFHELPDLPENLTQMASASTQPPPGQTMNLPFAPKQQMSALETLAEVSRQHLDLSGKRIPGKTRTPRKSPPPSNNLQHGTLLDEFIVQDERPEGNDAGSVPERHETSTAPPLPSMYSSFPLPNSPSSSPHLGGIPLPTSAPMAQMVPSQASLVMAASAANELQSMLPLTNGLMEPDLGASNTAISDKYFHTPPGRQQWSNIQSSPIDPMLQDTIREPQVSPRGENANRSTPHPRPIAMNPGSTHTHFTTDFSMNQKPAKPKVRGRFSDTRRKEVQEVRKRGACIRCRMLKKPCSGESPCSTCVNVESARLWKQPCIRTRIAEEFNLYSAGLYAVLAFHAVSQARGQIQLDQIPGRIEATHHPESATFVTFTPLKCQTARGSDIDPAILGNGLLGGSDLEIIDSDTDDIGGKLDHYIKRLAPSFYESEESNFMKPTLQTAFKLAMNNRDGLLGRVLELWIATRILTDHTLEWHIFSNPSLPPAMAPSPMLQSDLENSTRTPITSNNNRESYELIKMQLVGALEKRAANLARVAMNDLERRLLQRQQADPFETFLVSVVLLACVERMCWLFKTWESPTTSTNQGNGEKVHSSITDESAIAQALQAVQSPSEPHTRNARWPLDKQPAYYSQQGERFSDILYMLLKMRSIPPKPVTRQEDGVLCLNGEETNSNAGEWYESIKITASKLVERRDARFEGHDSREWELKYASKIIGG